MDKEEWRDWLRPFVGQAGLLTMNTQTTVTRGSGVRGTFGSYQEESHAEVWSVFVLEGDVLDREDATVLLAKQCWRNINTSGVEALSREMIQELLSGVAPPSLKKSEFLREVDVRLPTEFLEEPLPFEQETFERMHKDVLNGPRRWCKKDIIMGNEAVLRMIKNRSWQSRLQRVKVISAFVEASLAYPQYPKMHLDDDFRTARLTDLYEFCGLFLRRGSNVQEEKALRDTIEGSQKLLERLGLGEHPLVVRSRELLRPEDIPLPLPVLPST